MHGIELGVLAILGICIAGGVIGAFIFQKLNMPQVVGYIVVGVLIGDTGFGLLHPDDIQALSALQQLCVGPDRFFGGR